MNENFLTKKGLQQHKAMRIAKLVFVPSVLHEELQFEERQEAIRVIGEIGCDHIDRLTTDENSDKAETLKEALRADVEQLATHYVNKQFATETKKVIWSERIHAVKDGVLEGIGISCIIKVAPKIISKII